MLIDSKEIKKNIKDIDEVISEGLKNPVINYICIQRKKQNSDKIKNKQDELSRFIGFCILFRKLQDAEDYMLIRDKKEQVEFLKNKIAKELGIPKNEIEERKKEIVQYAYQNFKKRGYVFHAANSVSVRKKMNYGLNGSEVNVEHQKELLRIEKIYRKYEPDALYSPLGFVALDIEENKTGWFFDGSPIRATIYANSPEWFNYFCGKSYIYFDAIPEERRTGYANKDYKTALDAVIWLVKNKNMSLEDRKEIMLFFMKCWDLFKEATPCLMFIPVDEVEVNCDLNIEQYLDDNGTEELFNDIILGKVYDGENCCCKKNILPEKLLYVDLSPILPKYKIERKNKMFNSYPHRVNKSKNIYDGEER